MRRKYPHKTAQEILQELIRATPGEEGKWFAAAKEAGLYDEALAVANSSPRDPRMLTRAARDLAAQEPDFAIGAGLYWLAHGYGYEVTGDDVWTAYSTTIAAAQMRGNVLEVRERVRQIVAAETPGGFVAQVLRSELGV